MSRIVIFANGDLPNQEAAQALLRVDDTIIAADGGLRHLLAMGRLPSLLIGDLDSVEAVSLHFLEESGVKIHRYPQDKNQTDLELALLHALDLKAEHILIVGGLGGRLDQTLANLSLLTNPEVGRADVRLDDGVEEVFFCRASPNNIAQAKIQGKMGDFVSLIPWGGPVEGIVTRGLQWRLVNETLYPHLSRGISNILLRETALVEIKTGLLLVVHRRKE